MIGDQNVLRNGQRHRSGNGAIPKRDESNEFGSFVKYWRNFVQDNIDGKCIYVTAFCLKILVTNDKFQSHPFTKITTVGKHVLVQAAIN